MLFKINGNYAEKRNNEVVIFDDETIRRMAIDTVKNADEDDVEWGEIWFDGMTREEMIEATIKDIKKGLDEYYFEEQKIKEINKRDAVLMPENVEKDGQVSVTLRPDGYALMYKYDWDFIKLMHEKQLTWNKPYWIKDTCDFVSVEDAAAEIINNLLNLGYVVTCKNETVRTKAINSDYEPMPTRIIKSGQSKILIEWQGKNDDIYQDARKIKSSTWQRPWVVVDPAKYMDIEGFAEKWGFVITQQAKNLMQKTKAEVEETIVKVAPPKVYTPKEFNGEAVLNSSREILDRHRLES